MISLDLTPDEHEAMLEIAQAVDWSFSRAFLGQTRAFVFLQDSEAGVLSHACDDLVEECLAGDYEIDHDIVGLYAKLGIAIHAA